MKIQTSIIALIAATLICGCDEGRIYEPEKTASSNQTGLTLSASIENAASWPATYTVSLAAFAEDNDYALVSKSIGAPSPETGLYQISLTNIPSEASTVEICVIDRLRLKIASFYSIDIETLSGDFREIEEKIDADMFGVVQDRVFSTTCANCHGGSSFAAANLYLTPGLSYENLVDKESTVEGNGVLRVKPGDKNNSLLYQILSGDKSATWNYDHSSEITDYNIIELIGNWIDNAATYGTND